MNLFTCRSGWLVLLAGLVGSSLLRAAAQESPALVVSVASAERLLGDVGYLTQAAGTPQIGGLVTLMAGPYLEALNAKKPAGLLLTFQSSQPIGVAFLSVSSVDVALKKFREQGVEPEDIGGGVKKLRLQRDLFAKEQGGWLFFSDQAANLARVPEDPSRFLAGLETAYEVAVQVHPRRIPPELRDKVLAQLREYFERDLQRQLEGVPESNRPWLAQLRRGGFQNVVSLAQDAEQLTAGWGVDSQAGKTYLDVNVVAAPETGLARRLAALRERPADFGGFLLPGATATLHYGMQASPDDVQPLLAALAELRTRANTQIDKDPGLPGEAARAAVKQSLGLLFDVLQSTLQDGRLDGGAAIVLSPGAVQLVAGGRVTDGAKLAEAAKKFVEVAKANPRFPEVRFDTEIYQGVRLHTFSVPIPDRDKNARQVLGEQLDVVLGTGPDRVFLAFGKECVGLLKKVLDASAAGAGQTALPASLKIAVTPILELAARVENNPVVSTLAQALKKTPGKDHVLLTVRGIERGVSYRLEVEEGLLQLIGQAARLRGARGTTP